MSSPRSTRKVSSSTSPHSKSEIKTKTDTEFFHCEIIENREIQHKKFSAEKFSKSPPTKSNQSKNDKIQKKITTKYYIKNFFGFETQLEYSSSWHNYSGFAKMVIQNEENKKSVYEGNFINGVPNGHGIMQAWIKNEKKHWIKTLSRYEGNWNDGFRSSEKPFILNYQHESETISSTKNEKEIKPGIMIYSNGDKYIGHWKEDKRDDKLALLTYAQGGSYEGGFLKDKFSGKGTRIYSGGAKYEGLWERGFRKDECANFILPDGRRYVGAWDDEFCEGNKGVFLDALEKVIGESIWDEDEIIFHSAPSSEELKKTTIIYSDGKIYDGDSLDEKENGFGEVTYLDGKKEQICFHQGKVYFYEVVCDEEGNQYKGTLIKDLCDGFGMKIYSNGGLYQGEWKENLFHGKGTFTWPNKRQYMGEWKDGLMHGVGTMKYIDGLSYEGEWKEGEKNGFGKIFSSDKSERLEAFFVSGNIEGKVKFKLKDEFECECSFLLPVEKIHGDVIWRDKEGYETRGHFTEGIPTDANDLARKFIYEKLCESEFFSCYINEDLPASLADTSSESLANFPDDPST